MCAKFIFCSGRWGDEQLCQSWGHRSDDRHGREPKYLCICRECVTLFRGERPFHLLNRVNIKTTPKRIFFCGDCHPYYYYVYNWLVMDEVVIITLHSVYWGALRLRREYWTSTFPGLAIIGQARLDSYTALNIAIVNGFILKPFIQAPAPTIPTCRSNNLWQERVRLSYNHSLAQIFPVYW